MNLNKSRSVNNQGINYQHSLSSPSSLYSYSSSTSSYPSFINGVQNNTNKESSKNIDITGNTEKKNAKTTSNITAGLPLIFKHGNKVKIPSKIEYALRRHIPKGLLEAIHPNIDVSVELCLLFTTNLTSPYFEISENSTSSEWKALKAAYLRDFLCTPPTAYKNVIKALEFPLKTGAILECDYTSAKGKKCYNYRLGGAYIKKGIVNYELKTKEAIHLLDRQVMRLYNNAMQNSICRNLIQFYKDVTLPSIEEIKAKAIRLIKSGYKNKDGKKLTFLNKHAKSYFKNPEELTFVEDAIKTYQNLTENGLMIPCPGSEASGGRVVDSFTLMPRWIRNMVKIKGESFVEADYSCLHPNIANAEYGGKLENISHEALAGVLGIDLIEVKKAHLSFFNTKAAYMHNSVVYPYYKEFDPVMLKKIKDEKYKSIHKHKATSRKMFKKEVEIMTNVIEQLNQEQIYVGYEYDALFCHPEHARRLKQVMDDTILKHGIKTTAKLSVEKKEKWISINGYENYYEISESGLVRGIERKITYEKGNRSIKARILKARINNRGYKEVRLSKNGKTETKYVHILTAKAFIANPENKPEVNHLDGNKLSNHYTNLEWATHSENVLHAYRTGLIIKKTKTVIDNCTGKIFPGIKEASIYYDINLNTLKGYLNGHIKTNPTCLKYENAA